MCRGMWVSQVEPCNHRFVTAGLYSIEWINGGLELLITSRRNNFLISSTEIVSTNEFYFTVFVNIKLTSQGRTESCRNIHLTLFIYLFIANGTDSSSNFYFRKVFVISLLFI